MPSAFRIIRLSSTLKALEEQLIERSRAAIRDVRQMLADNPRPDTFLGRKRQEALPDKDDALS